MSLSVSLTVNGVEGKSRWKTPVLRCSIYYESASA
jgi:hypothetical protein